MNKKKTLFQRSKHRKKNVITLLICAMQCISFQVYSQTLVIPPDPGNLSSVEGLIRSADYKVEVKKSGDTNFTECFVYKTINSWTASSIFTAKPQESASFTNISFSNTAVDVRITTNFNASNVTIRPLNYGISSVRNGNVITFRLDKPVKISIEVNNRLKPLFLFADTPDIAPSASQTTYFYGPGVHKIGLAKKLKSNDKVYIAAGAVVEGSFFIPWNTQNISIKGRGILTMGEWKHTSTDLTWLGEHSAIKANGVSNLEMEGIIFANITGWNLSIYNSDNLTHDNQYRNLKMINWNGNTDGIWVNGDKNIVDDCFIFNNDDCIMSHGSTNSKVSNMVFWGGPWGRILWLPSFFATSNFTMENINVIGRDGSYEPLILVQREKDMSQINFKNIRFEQRASAKFLEIENAKNGKIKNWKFTDITLDDQKNDEGFILGNATGTVDDITFSNLKMGGKVITSIEESKMTKNAYATNIKFDTAIITAPSGFKAGSVADTQLTLSWLDNSDNETEFVLERRNVTAGGDYALVKSLTPGTTTFKDTGLIPGTSYNYRISAKNSNSQSSFVYLSNVTTLSAPVLAPSALSVTAVEATQATLKWVDNSNNETEFVVDRRSITDGEEYALVKSFSANSTFFTDQTLSPDKEYRYRLSAKNGDRVSDFAYSDIFKTPEAPGTGLQGVYYNNTDFTGTFVSRVDSNINFNWGSGSPATDIQADTFSARWTGLIKPGYTETYTFYTTSDDGIRLWIDDVLLINKWVNQGSTEHKATIQLNAGQKYKINAEYFENTVNALAQLSWSSTSLKKEIVPQSSLYPSSASLAKKIAGANSEGEISDNAVKVYPNPAKGVLHFTLSGAVQNSIVAELSSQEAKIIKNEKYNGVNINNTFTFDIGGLAAGIYFLKIYNGSQTTVKKIIISQ
ncbi:T9SS C-terminal target domain-containing protein [Flavobacterium circumlabens]|uniref:Secreted protein (Por secretion system target) n=1 Tax=Flavobacterium circumlabens TaxID=2133765 RepID=A0A4Y7UG41_9FLAO|nr:PA14 domain-containing protein [Flavobacterium circumlabens]TCN59586.1 putative secreted protein (Por secretion system target) [Flavobacterium circumlabens]TEB44868.1 T9SS C-terminal target domain-containing protein [Flavobacterium circumlabens]